MSAKNYFICFLALVSLQANAQTSTLYHEQYRPQLHFSPQAHWMNDPNGMVYYDGVYHLFFQYYPDSTVWGPMHWGHAISKDLVHWQQQKIALYPDSLGYIFSGSAIVDENNTSGFGKNGKPPLVAMFTQHNEVAKNAGKINFQNQSIAYSNDNGKTWIKYAGNPVLKNPGIADFRDPKVMWFAPQKKWIVTLAVKDHVSFYSSPDLKTWTKESDFGKEAGAHKNVDVWECPDLFSLNDNGKKIWVLIVSINPGAPNGGSGTQYFVGDFDGKTFSPFNTKIKWIDYGPDDYAGITWSNTGDRKFFIGWMSNWSYATKVPSVKWRSAMTVTRELKTMHVGDDIFLTSQPVDELNNLETKTEVLKDVIVNNDFDLSSKINDLKFPCRINLSLKKTEDFSFIFSNDIGEKLQIGYDKNDNTYFIDRMNSGKTDFEKSFAAKHVASRILNADSLDISLIIDKSSVELFADKGLSVMTEIFFPSKPYNKINIQSANCMFNKIEVVNLNSIWPD